MKRSASPPFLFAALFAAGLAAQAPAPDKPAPDKSTELRSKDVEVRLAAIDAIAASGRKDAESLLLPLLADRDWEIQERTAAALGKLKSKQAIGQLVELAVDGDVARVRRAAAFAVAAVDAADGASRIWRQAKGRRQVA